MNTQVTNPNQVLSKTCNKCGETKPHTEYYYTERDGYAAQCKSCRRAKVQRHRDKCKEAGKPTHRNAGNIPGKLWNDARRRAKKKSLEFSMTKEWVKEEYSKGICSATGLPFGPVGSQFAPSLDRIDNSKGYTPDNVQMTCWIHNRCKDAATEADVLRFAQAYIRHQG